MRQHAAGMLRQIRQQLELLRRQAHLFAVSQHAEPLAIDHQPAAHDRLGRRRRRVRRAAAPRGCAPAVPRRRTAWSRSRRRRRRARAPCRLRRRARRARGSARSRICRTSTAHLDAVDVRQAEVEHDEIRLVAFDRLERRASGHRGSDLVAARAQQRRHRADDVRLVVDDEDARRPSLERHGGRAHRCRARRSRTARRRRRRSRPRCARRPRPAARG